MLNSENTDLFLKCSCGCSALLATPNKEEHETEIYVSLWGLGFDNRIPGLLERLRWCWRIFTTGNPYADTVILSECDAKKLATFIIENTKEST